MELPKDSESASTKHERILSMKKEKFCSLNVKLLVWALAFIIPIIGLFWIGVSLAMRSFEKQLILTNQQILKPYISEIEVTLETIHSYVANKEIPTEILESLDADSEFVRMEALQNLSQYYTEDIFTYPKIDAVFLKKGEAFRFLRNVNSDYAQQCKAAEYVEKFTETIGEEDHPFQRGYRKFEVGEKPYFLLALQSEDVIWGCWIRADVFLKKIESQEMNGLNRIFLRDPDGIWSDQTYEEENIFVVEQSSSDGSFELVALLNRAEVFRSFENLNDVLFVLICFSIFILIAYLCYLSVHFTKPVKNLSRQMNRVKKGDFNACPIPEGLDNELREVYETMNSMTAEIAHLKIDVYEEKLKKQEAKMQLMQSQIKPHFFLNSLTTILGFAQAKDYEMVQKMTLCLSKHFRYILYRDNMISLEEELEHIQNYLEIQKIKKQTGFQYEICVEDELYEEEIPILSLQTLVENALKHSLKDEVKIIISGKIERRVKEEYLVLCVEDNGGGFSEEVLEKLNRRQPITSGQADGGIGLYNVWQRLEILYDQRATMYFSNREEGGACVEMRLPRGQGRR